MFSTTLLLLALYGASGCGSRCGDGEVGDGEDCEGGESRPCESECGSAGSQFCEPSRCQWATCEPPEEQCNGDDDDCDGEVDEDFDCARGGSRECETECGSAGDQRCEEQCVWGACEPPVELCGNGVDDDCDGTTDQPEAEFRVTVVAEHAGLWRFSAIADREGYSIASVTQEGALTPARVVITRLEADAENVRSVDGLDLLHNVAGGGPTVARCEDYLGIAWTTEQDLRFSVIRDGTSSRSEPVVVEREAIYAPMSFSMIWSGHSFVVAYPWRRGGAGQIRLRRFGTDGGSLGTSLQVSQASMYVGYPSMTLTDDGVAVAWEDNRNGAFQWEVYLARATAELRMVGTETRITTSSETGNARAPSLAWNGEGFGLAWVAGEDHREQVFFVRLSREGERLGTARRVAVTRGRARHPSLVWTGHEYALAWRSVEGPHDRGNIFFVRLTSDGRRVAPSISVGDRGVQRGPELLWTGAEYGLLWTSHGEDGTGRVLRLARLRCE